MTNLFIDKQLGKTTSFSFPRPFSNNLDNISGLFSYGDKEGLVWNGLVPMQEDSKPTYDSFEEALKAYNSKKYFVITAEQAEVIKRKESYGIHKHNDMLLLWKNFLTESYMEKYGFDKVEVKLSLV